MVAEDDQPCPLNGTRTIEVTLHRHMELTISFVINSFLTLIASLYGTVVYISGQFWINIINIVVHSGAVPSSEQLLIFFFDFVGRGGRPRGMARSGNFRSNSRTYEVNRDCAALITQH